MKNIRYGRFILRLAGCALVVWGLTLGARAQVTTGSILGTVTSVSAFLVTKEGIASRVGNPEVVYTLIGQNRPAIEVVATLEEDTTTFSGYRWSSSDGPELRMTPGTTTTGRVVVEQRTPLTYLLPFLRDISGFY